MRDEGRQMTRRGRERARETWTGSRVDSLGIENLAAARAAGYEPDGDWLVGRDPRRMTRAEIEAIGHEPMSPIQVIRAKCLDCCAGSSDEVRKCVAMACPLWPFRAGKNPWRAPMSEERREALRAASPFSKPQKIEAPSAESPRPDV